MPCSWIRQHSVRKTPVLPKLIHTFIVIVLKVAIFFFFLESEKLIPSKNTQESPEKEAQWTKDMNRLFKEEKKRKENGLYIVKSYSVLLILREN